jgi:hypothetical protein
MVFITIVTGAYKPTYNWGGPHCVNVYSIKPWFLPRSKDSSSIFGSRENQVEGAWSHWKPREAMKFFG